MTLEVTFLTCMYCGKPNIHPERVYRYCTSSECIKDGQSMVSPRYQTTTVSSDTADLINHNSELSNSLSQALETIKQLTENNALYKDSIARLVTNQRKALNNEISVARWDVIRLLIKHHSELERGLYLGENREDYDFFPIYDQAYRLLDFSLKKLGIDRIGTLNEQVQVNHYYHESWSPAGAPVTVVSAGYYFPQDDYVIQKAIVIGDQDVNPYDKD